MKTINKDEILPLNVTQEARHRIYVGLGWDPKSDVSLIDKAKELIGGPRAHHDLDLSCYLYDEKHHMLELISGGGAHIDQSGHVYHSGDNIEGVGDGDDEQISVELKDIDPKVHHIIFTATIKSGHNFGDIKAPEIHLSDGYSGREFLRSPLAQAEGKNKTGFVFVHLFRSKDGNGWMMHNIARYIHARDLEDWPALVASFIHIEDDEQAQKAAN